MPGRVKYMHQPNPSPTHLGYMSGFETRMKKKSPFVPGTDGTGGTGHTGALEYMHMYVHPLRNIDGI